MNLKIDKSAATREEPSRREHRLLVELRAYTGQAMRAVVRRMFETADDLVYDMGQSAESQAERRRYFDAVRVLRIHRKQVEDAFAKALQAGFTAKKKTPPPVEVDADDLSMQTSEELETQIAIGNLVARADGTHRPLIWETERRLTKAVGDLHLRVSGQALSPEHLGSAFGEAAASLPTEFEIKLIIFKLFERRLITDLEDFYDGILEIFQQYGIGKAKPATKSRRREPAKDQNQALRQLADRWFDALTGAGLLPRETRSLLEPLRKPVIAAALADYAHLDDPQHPLRVALSEVVELAVAARAGDTAADERLRDRITAWSTTVTNVGRAANEPTAPAADSGAVLAQALQNHLTALQAQSRQRNSHLLRGLRRMVADELQRSTAERPVPEPVMPLLRSGIAPLLAVALLRHGRASAAYREAHEFLERVIDSIRREQQTAERDALMLSLDKALIDIGMDRAKVDRLLGGLREIYDALELDERRKRARPPPADPPEPAVDKPGARGLGPEDIASANIEELRKLAAYAEDQVLLRRLFRVGAWYRVYDCMPGQMRWLRLDNIDLERGALAFSGFDADSVLELTAESFAEDLAHGRSYAVNPTADERVALYILCQRLGRNLAGI